MKKMEDVKKRSKTDKDDFIDDNEDFIITEIEPADRRNEELRTEERQEVEQASTLIGGESKPVSDRVKVKFVKFVQLVATHNFEKVMKQKPEEEIIVSSDLLTELAISHEEEDEEDRKLPVLMVVAFLIGVVLTWLVIKY